MKLIMNILFATSEAAPFAKSGGLGDVSGSLPKAVKKKGIDISVIMPKYADIPNKFTEKMKFLTEFNIYLNWRNQSCKIYNLQHENVIYYFISNSYYFNREKLYGYFDEAERYLFFSRAVLESIPFLKSWPDIIHCNDWQTAAIPFLLNKQYRIHYHNIKTIITIHNLKYQGRYGKNTIYDILGLKPEDITSDIEYNNDVNLMKGALYNSNYITTVSPTYAEEIQYEYFGEGLDGVLRDNNRKLIGILNGIDYDKYNPKNDKNLYVNYTRSYNKKQENKKELLKEIGLDTQLEEPIICIISRLVEQKGLDLVAHVIFEIMKLNTKLIILGTGEEKFEKLFKQIKNSYTSKVSLNLVFNSKLAVKIYAGSDMLLMPSRFEPCGLSQIIAMRFGTIPIVRKTGGLNDTVKKFDDNNKEGTGFVFDNYNAHEMLSEISRAVDLYNDKETWKNIVSNALKAKFNWKKSASEYIKLYKTLVKK